MTAFKVLATAIRLAFDWVNVQAVVTGLTGISRIDRNHLHPCLNGFVGNEQAQLIERPAIRPSALRLGARQFVGAFPNARQILHGNHSLKCFGLLHDRFADSMIQPLLIATLSARQPLQNLSCPAASRPCAFRGFVLQRCSDLGKSISNLLDVLTVPLFSFRCHGNISASKVNANHITGLNWLWRFILELNVQVELAITVLAQLSAGRLAAFELASLVVASIQLHFLSALDGGDADFPILLPEGEQVFVTVHAGRCKLFNGFAFELCRFAICADTSASPNRHVCHQAKLGFDGLVGQGLQCNLVSDFGFCVVVDIVAGIRKRAEGRVHFGHLLRSRLKLYNDCQDLFHESNNTTCGRLRQLANSALLHSPCYPPTTRLAEVVATRVFGGVDIQRELKEHLAEFNL